MLSQQIGPMTAGAEGVDGDPFSHPSPHHSAARWRSPRTLAAAASACCVIRACSASHRCCLSRAASSAPGSCASAAAAEALSGFSRSAVTWLGAVSTNVRLCRRLGPSGVSYSSTCSCRSPSHESFESFQCSRTGAPRSATWLARASANCLRPPLKEPTVCPLTSGRRGSRGGLVLLSSARCWKSCKAPATSEPPFFSRTCTRPVAASAERRLGSPA
mmetsp:Transcript_46686/g.146331  ORF Transcript_46686/g.146331 Transcript_46686/m.146331 type:complete len:217 (+) Transcript_46686:1178-1828(+)